MKRFSILMMVTILTFIIAACSNESSTDKETSDGAKPEQQTETLTITHELGETEVSKNPEKVIVFDFGTLDTLDELGINVIALPKSTVPTYLSKYEEDQYENVGSLKEPDFDKISELQPDLIIISSRQLELYDEFSKLGPTIYLQVDPANYLESFTNNVKILGTIFDKEDKIDQALAEIKQSIDQLKEKAASVDGKGLVILANDGKVSAYGSNSRFGIIHDVFGIQPVDENIEVSTHGQSISFEYIVEKDPDYLFVVDRGAVVGGESSAKQVVENDLVKSTQAYKNNKVVYLDPNYWYLSGGGLVSVSEMIKEIENGIK